METTVLGLGSRVLKEWKKKMETTIVGYIDI